MDDHTKESLHKIVDDADMVDADEISLHNVINRLDKIEKRNAVLEAAVAFHGFDELPERKLNRFGRSDVRIDLIDVDGTVHYNNLHESLAGEYEECCFTGWRYPVEDLS